MPVICKGGSTPLNVCTDARCELVLCLTRRDSTARDYHSPDSSRRRKHVARSQLLDPSIGHHFRGTCLRLLIEATADFTATDQYRDRL